MNLLAFGEILWDVFDGYELLGGAPLNFSVAAHRLGNSVKLITGVGEDLRGKQALASLKMLGLASDFVQVTPESETGAAKVTIDRAGKVSFFIKRPAAFDFARIDNKSISNIAGMESGWLYFGTLAQFTPGTEQFVNDVRRLFPQIKCFYDANLRDRHWDLPLVQRLSHLATVLKLNTDEAHTLFRMTHRSDIFTLEQFCRDWGHAYSIKTICITLGAEGCAVFEDDVLYYFQGIPVDVVDTVGAGDAFAAGFLHGYESKWPLARAAAFANALGALVASRPGATPPWEPSECWSLLDGTQGLISAATSETDVGCT